MTLAQCDFPCVTVFERGHMRCVSVIDGGLKCLEQLAIANPSQTLNKIYIKYSQILASVMRVSLSSREG